MRDVTVIGAGVSGLTSAISLQEQGYHVHILTKDVHPNITSSVAAALWFPYEAFPIDKVEAWATQTYKVYAVLCADSMSGVRMIESLQLSDGPFERPGWVSNVDGYRDVGPDDLPDGFIDGYTVRIPVIETPKFMPYLMERFRKNGGTIEQRKDGIQSFDGLETDVIVNCTGLGARHLCNDSEVFPILGQVVRIANHGQHRAICDDHSAAAIGYIIPRSDDVILGGTSEKGHWSLTPSDEITSSILNKCRKLDPSLETVEILETRCGLRPGRTSVRLEVERTTGGHQIIHNYGHGGAGFTLAWGCAREVVELVQAT